MKQEIHPKWYPEAEVICACGNTWTTGSTVPEIRTEICSNCHPFFTGEQRIVDTEGQVDRFMKRLQARDEIRRQEEEKLEQLSSPDRAISEFNVSTRSVNALSEAGIETAGDFLARLQEVGEDGILEIHGFGVKGLTDLRRELRSAGFEIPDTSPEEVVEAATGEE
jgi:large subunit ribosomal protein L31